jgi:uncharacterized protein
MRSRYWPLLLLVLLVLGVAPGPAVERFLFDQEHLLDLEQGSQLDSLLRAHEASTGNEIAVVTTRSLNGYPDMPAFAASFGDSLGVGKKGRDNGVVIAVSRELRSVFVATGLGTEEVLTDEQCAVIVDSLMIPRFKEGRFGEGIVDGARAIVLHLEKPENRIH